MSELKTKRRVADAVAQKVARLAETAGADAAREALAFALDAKEGEYFREALLRLIDTRIRYNRWYRRLYRTLTRNP